MAYQFPLWHSSPQGECPIETSTMKLARTIISRPCSVHEPSTCGDTWLPSWSTTCPHLKRVLVQKGGSLSTSCVRDDGEPDTMPPPKEHSEFLVFYQEETWFFLSRHMAFFKLLFGVSENWMYCWNPHPSNMGDLSLNRYLNQNKTFSKITSTSRLVASW